MGPADPAPPIISVEVVYCPRTGETDQCRLRLPAGSTVAQALRASGVLERHGLPQEGLRVGVWCKPCEPDLPLRDLDRVEIYLPLIVDPKEARRQRYKGQRLKAKPIS